MIYGFLIFEKTDFHHYHLATLSRRRTTLRRKLGYLLGGKMPYGLPVLFGVVKDWGNQGSGEFPVEQHRLRSRSWITSKQMRLWPIRRPLRTTCCLRVRTMLTDQGPGERLNILKLGWPSVSQLWCHLAVSLLLMLQLTSFMAAGGFARWSCLAASFTAVSVSSFPGISQWLGTLERYWDLSRAN